MPYSSFDIEKVETELGITVDYSKDLFRETLPASPSPWLSQTLSIFLPMGTTLTTEKSRSEFIIAPVLGDVAHQTHEKILLFSGNEFNVDADRGLNGFCDFLISKSSDPTKIQAPVLMIVEAKKEDIFSGVGQCIAELVAAQIFNQHRNQPRPRLYGAVSSGSNWRFIVLEGTTAYLDRTEYYISQVDKILGILLYAVQ